MIKQLSLCLNTKQKSMYIIQQGQLRLQKMQGHKDCDLLKIFHQGNSRKMKSSLPTEYIPLLFFSMNLENLLA